MKCDKCGAYVSIQHSPDMDMNGTQLCGKCYRARYREQYFKENPIKK